MNPIHYSLCLEPDLNDFTFKGTVEIQFSVSNPAAVVSLDALDLQVHGCSFRENGTFEPCPFQMHTDKETLEITPPAEISEPLLLKIDFTGEINDKLAGFYRSGYGPEEDRKFIAVTQFQEDDARRAFPCLDHPSKKATFDIEIVLDESLVAISNEAIKKTEPAAGGKKRVSFYRTPKMSTYLLFFGIGDFKIKTHAEDPRVRVVALPDREAYTDYGLDFGEKSLRFCEDYFDIPYPLKKMDLIAIPDFAFGAMENWGAITFRENLLLYYPGTTSKAGEERIREVTAHEIVHQWFGDLVTPSDWKYLWLNESFATYFGFGVVDHYYPEWDTWDQFLNTQTLTALKRDSLNETFPIELPGGETVAINMATAPLIYNKGGSILRQIEGYIGTENFREGLRDFLRKHEYDCAASHHLWEAFERASETPIVQMMKGWIEQPGFPLIEADRDGDRLIFTQKRFTYLPNDSDHTWQIPLTVRTFDRSGESKTRTTLLDDKTGSLDIGEDVAAYKINDGQTGFFRTKYLEVSNRDALGKLILQKKLPAVDRWGVEQDLFALVMSGDVSMEDYLRFIENYQSEDAFLPLSSIAGNLLHAYLVLNNGLKQRVATLGKSFLEAALERFGYEPAAGEPHTRSVLRDRIIGHALLYGSKKAEAFAQNQVRLLRAGQTVHPDIQKSMMQAAAQIEGENAYEWFVDRFKKAESEHERMNVLIALGCFKERKTLEKALRFTFDAVPARNKFIPIASAAANPNAQSYMWEWYLAHREELETFHPLLYERVIDAIIPVCGLGAPDDVKTFFTGYIDEHAYLKDTVRMSLERLEVNVRLRGADPNN